MRARKSTQAENRMAVIPSAEPSRVLAIGADHKLRERVKDRKNSESSSWVNVDQKRSR